MELNLLKNQWDLVVKCMYQNKNYSKKIGVCVEKVSDEGGFGAF